MQLSQLPDTPDMLATRIRGFEHALQLGALLLELRLALLAPRVQAIAHAALSSGGGGWFTASTTRRKRPLLAIRPLSTKVPPAPSR
jgi:hypothetical protein